MTNFDTLQQDWGQIRSENPLLPEEHRHVFSKLKKIQARLVFVNLALSVAFAVVFVVLGWVWSAFPGREPLFYGSLAAMFVLLSLSLGLFWYQILFWKTPDFSEDVLSFSTRIIRKLKFSMWLTNVYIPIYALSLCLILMAYYRVILAQTDAHSRFFIYLGTFGWIIIVTGWGWLRKRKKNQRDIVPIIEELQRIQKALREE